MQLLECDVHISCDRVTFFIRIYTFAEDTFLSICNITVILFNEMTRIFHDSRHLLVTMFNWRD